MNQQTKNILHASVAGMALAVRGKGGAHSDRKPIVRNRVSADEMYEAMVDYAEKTGRNLPKCANQVVWR